MEETIKHKGNTIKLNDLVSVQRRLFKRQCGSLLVGRQGFVPPVRQRVLLLHLCDLL